MVSGTNDRYLQSKVALPLIYKIMEPNLIWLNMTHQIKEDTNAFMYQYDSTGKSADSRKETPPKHAMGTRFPELDRSRKATASGLTKANGFSMRIPRAVIRSPAGKNEIMDDYEYAAYWMAEWMNTNILNALTSGASTPSWTPTATWDDGASAPVDDLIWLDAAMDQEGYPFRMTDAYINKQCWYELKGYLTNVDVGDAKQKAMYGVPEITKDIIRVPVVDADIHKVMSGMSDGYVLALDRNNISAETHYFIDTKFSQAKVTYETVVDRKPTKVTVPNLGIHFKQFEENETSDTILQFWVENATVVTKPKGLLYDNGI